MNTDRVPNQALLRAGLEVMEQAGKPLQRLPTQGRAMLYRMRTGETVRVRTCNDHILVAVADRATGDAKLNIEGTDYLLIVMPEIERRFGPVIAYFVPTDIAVQAVKDCHAEWLSAEPNTKGDNRTWNIWFGHHPKSGGFATRWAKYRLDGSGSASASQRIASATAKSDQHAGSSETLGQVIAAARKAIADKAGVAVDAVKISIDLS